MIRLPAARRAREVADWVEVELLFGDHQSVTSTELYGLLSDDLGLAEEWADVAFGETGRSLSELGDQEDQLARTIEDSFFLLQRRVDRTGDRFPLAPQVDGWSLKAEWTETIEYAFLALLNARVLLGLGNAVSHHAPAILFERLVGTSLAAYLDGESARFGVPHPDFQGDFPARARLLAARMRERPQSDLTTVTAQQGDFGLDVAAWRSFDDRESKVVILCQCGIGADFEEKPLPPSRWGKVIDFVCPPLTALAIPFQDFGPDAKMRSLAVDAGILLDRTRLAKFANLSSDAGLQTDISGWILEVLPSFEYQSVDV